MRFSIINRSNSTFISISNYLSSIIRAIRHPLASDVGFLTASQYLSGGLGFLTAIAASRLLGPSNYGVVALIIAYPTLLRSFFSVKSVSVTTRYIASFRATEQTDKLKAICKIGYALDLFISVLAFIFISLTSSWIAHHLYNMPKISWLMVAYAASFPFFSLAGTSRAILSSWQKFRWLAIFQFLHRGFILIFVISFLLAGLGVPGMVIGMAAGNAAFGLAMLSAATYLLFREGLIFWWKAPISKIASLRKELSAFFGWNYLMVTLIGAITQMPLMLLGYFRGPEEAGFFRLATTLTNVSSHPKSSLSRVVYPKLSAYWGIGKRKNLKGKLKSWTLQAGLPLGTFMLLMIPFFPILIPKVFGSGYTAMVPGTQAMIIGAAVSTIFFWLDPYYYASGKIGVLTKSFGIYTAVTLSLGLLCIQEWGFLGIATLVAVGRVLYTLFLSKFVWNMKVQS